MAATVERKCQCCGATMTVRAADVARGWGKFCSKRCKAIKQEQSTGQYARFMARRRTADGDDELKGFVMSQEDLSAGGYGDADKDDPLCDGKW